MRNAPWLATLALLLGAVRAVHAQPAPEAAPPPAAPPPSQNETPASGEAAAPASVPVQVAPLPEAAPGSASVTESAPESVSETESASEPESETASVSGSGAEAALAGGASADRVAEPVYPIFDPQARLIMGAQKLKVHPEGPQIAEDNRQPFFFEQARVELDFEANDTFSGSFSAELSGKPAVRDAYVNLKLARKFQIRAGHFKRPMSRTELTSTGRLPFRDRGLFNRYILRDQQWGNRSLGVMLWGKFKSAHLNWYAAVMNANDTLDTSEIERIRGADALARVEYEPTKWLEIGINGGYKVTELYADGPNVDLFAFGGDVRVHAGDLRVVLESIAAQNAFPPTPPPANGRTPFAANAMGYATYDVTLARDVIMQPTLLGEWYDSDTQYSGDQTLRGVLGLNFLFFDQQYRVLPQIEIIRPIGADPERNLVELERYYVMLSAQL
jgi:hypothetical protein